MYPIRHLMPIFAYPPLTPRQSAYCAPFVQHFGVVLRLCSTIPNAFWLANVVMRHCPT
jgi:hypothetical protein